MVKRRPSDCTPSSARGAPQAENVEIYRYQKAESLASTLAETVVDQASDNQIPRMNLLVAVQVTPWP